MGVAVMSPGSSGDGCRCDVSWVIRGWVSLWCFLGHQGMGVAVMSPGSSGDGCRCDVSWVIRGHHSDTHPLMAQETSQRHPSPDGPGDIMGVAVVSPGSSGDGFRCDVSWVIREWVSL